MCIYVSAGHGTHGCTPGRSSCVKVRNTVGKQTQTCIAPCSCTQAHTPKHTKLTLHWAVKAHLHVQHFLPCLRNLGVFCVLMEIYTLIPNDMLS